MGVDAIFSVSPYYNKPSQEGLYQHYKAIADAIEIPVMLYNVPGRTGVDITSKTVGRLFNDCPNIYAIKEATGSMQRCVELLSKYPELEVVSGDDAINYPILASGGRGVISVTSNLLPKKIANLVHFALDGDFEKSKKINEELWEINKVLFIQSNPIPIKYAMHIAGFCELEYRLPLTPPSKEAQKEIEKILAKYEIKD